MRAPEKSELPLRAAPFDFRLDENRRELFCKAFRSQSSALPPTWGAMALKGVFEIVEELEVDWRRLLHATQSFTYGQTPTLPCSAKAQTELLDCRYRAATHWLQFVTEVRDADSNALLLTSKTLILVKDA